MRVKIDVYFFNLRGPPPLRTKLLFSKYFQLFKGEIREISLISSFSDHINRIPLAVFLVEEKGILFFIFIVVVLEKTFEKIFLEKIDFYNF